MIYILNEKVSPNFFVGAIETDKHGLYGLL